MNAKKSADYCNLIENVKNKYRKNPICAKNLTLGWCDLRQGEDLCQEINRVLYASGSRWICGRFVLNKVSTLDKIVVVMKMGEQ